MKIKMLILVLSVISLKLIGQTNLNLDYYLPDTVTYDTAIPTPQEVIGYVPGEWHVSHDQLVSYMKAVAKASPRITLENRGTTFENRPLLLLTVTSEKNQGNLESIRTQHLKQIEGTSDQIDTTLPLIVYQGFSIHGNEPSGSNASLLAIYYLAAAQGGFIDKLLDKTVILFDPSFNPDGLQRFSQWANMHKNKNISTDPQDREYSEVWPGGRTNHYWFDMNRDWLPVQLPESKVRIKTFHQWYPNILTDHHEMGTNSSFFFQPGIPTRTHPLTPGENQKLTRDIAEFHAKALDSIGSLYYTEEDYDDYYYGKGSTFPDIHGAIGILFEQASSRGHAQESDNGILTFPFTIKNQFSTFLSTLKAGLSLKSSLQTYQQNFFKTALQNSDNSAYVISKEKDQASLHHFIDILKQHKIDVYPLQNDLSINSKSFKSDQSFVIPKKQRQSTLIEAIFEKRTTFQDSLFYDISAWTLPLAFNLDYTKTTKATYTKNSEVVKKIEYQPKPFSKSTYGYVIEWHEYYSPALLYQLQSSGLRVKTGLRPFAIDKQTFDYGSLFIPATNQEMGTTEVYTFLKKLSEKYKIPCYSVSTGLTEGIDLGSRQFKALQLPKIALLVGDGISPYNAGEIWHLMDQRFQIPITKLSTVHLQQKDLNRYTHIILVNDPKEEIDTAEAEVLRNWANSGGTLIGYDSSVHFLKRHNMINPVIKKTDRKATNISFEQQADYFGAQRIGGAIFRAKIDRSHPIAFGYTDATLPLFRRNTIFMEPDEQSFKNPIQYVNQPLLSGYISKENLAEIANTVPFVYSNLGKGKVMYFTDNTNFRAFWYGTNKLLMNTIFFDKLM
ncbi:M14 family metallopeptidase [Aquimarina sp. ERC-38]|uniref:M14 metallopeptidase family protein n=1 Tax=Aquimarina sp. ERC-38 TaxID=2949996 RepID=UPI0022464AC2|nr:M14 metallopeptidase family protein [Aquimarina sp. ERC-38]UZO80445.1 M14 family metallopeptidase [Aquimarina sp. ERC-38]